MNSPFHPTSAVIWAVALVLAASSASAQTLPPTSRTVYKCEDGNKVRYSDSPWLGAKKVDALFADKHTHTSKAGAELNAGFVAAELKPLLGL